MEIFIPSQTSMAQPLKFGNGWVILSYISMSLWLLIHAENKISEIMFKPISICIEFAQNILTLSLAPAESFLLLAEVVETVEFSIKLHYCFL